MIINIEKNLADFENTLKMLQLQKEQALVVRLNELILQSQRHIASITERGVVKDTLPTLFNAVATACAEYTLLEKKIRLLNAVRTHDK